MSACARAVDAKLDQSVGIAEFENFDGKLGRNKMESAINLS